MSSMYRPTLSLAPALIQADFAARRARLAAQLPDHSIVILATAPTHLRNNDAEYKYRADSSFYYLTGFAEPEALLVLEKVLSEQGNAELIYTLFVRPKDKLREIWDGRRAGIEGALAEFGAQQAYPINEADERLPAMLLGKQHVYARLDNDLTSWLAHARSLRRGEGVVDTVHNLDALLAEMRLIKDDKELALMQSAADISAAAHCRAMQTVRPEMLEYQLEAELLYVFGHYGCAPSYNSIVAGGDNANILHYVENDQPLRAGDLVMIDAGAEYQHYAGDISRTFPVSGTFSNAQRAVYDIVLRANLAAIDSLVAGVHARIHHETALRVLTQGLVELGILSGDIDTLIADKAYMPFYMHGTGHWLGMDVHDVGRYTDTDGKPRTLQAGMVITVEPGLYFAHDNPQVPKAYRGIGIRIEDDVVITEGAPRVLTGGVPKTVAEIEALMCQA